MSRRHPTAIAVTLLVSMLVPRPVFASNDALLKLLRVLRDRGSISAEEYEEIRQTADAGETTRTPVETPTSSPAIQLPAPALRAVTFTPNDMPVNGPNTPAEEPQAAPQEVPKPPPQTQKPTEKPWYERLSIRGYAQFRYTASDVGEGPALEVPADRSVNEAESFIIRRGRVVLSGDVTDRLGLYFQTETMGSTGAADFSLQLRDLYGDFYLNPAKTWRVRIGQSKIPFGWVNLQSSQNRAPLERPDAINTAAEGERDIGAFLMWASPVARQRFRDLTSQGLKGSGDYGVVAVGAYSGQGLNRSDVNGDPHVLARVSYPFQLASKQFFELGAQAYAGKFVTPTTPITVDGQTFTPDRPADGTADQRFGVTAVWYPQPIGIEAEWNVGRGPELSGDLRSITRESLNGGYVQLNYRTRNDFATWFPFIRWNYFDGARKFARNAPKTKVNEVDFGLELAKWAELEATIIYTRTFERTRTGTFPYSLSKDGNRLGFQVQLNY